jgi:hypothetical protein
MAEVLGIATGKRERFASPHRPRPVSDELNRVAALLRNACPPDTCVGFSFDGRLQVHIDVRKREHVMFVEMILPQLEGGLFQQISIGGKPGHPFYHRISAVIEA